MNLCVEVIGDVAVVTIHGSYLDASNHEEFRQAIAPVLDGNDKVLLDVGHLETVDSSGLGTFAFCKRRIEQRKGKLAVCSPGAQVGVAFDLIHLDRLIDLYGARDEALAAMQAQKLQQH